MGRKYKVRFTLFPIGQSMIDASDLFQQAMDEGHEIENHTLNHPYLSGLSDDGIRQQIEGHMTIYRKIFGSNATQRFLRPPYGDGILNYDPRIPKIAKEYGLIVAMWSEASSAVTDYPRADSAEINKIIQLCPTIPGALILQHALTAEYIAGEYLLQNAQSAGFTTRTLSEEVDNISPDANAVNPSPPDYNPGRASDSNEAILYISEFKRTGKLHNISVA